MEICSTSSYYWCMVRCHYKATDEAGWRMADGVGSNLQTYSVQDAVNEIYHMVQRLRTEYGTIPTRKNMAVVGGLQTFTEKFSDYAYPFSSDDDDPKMRILTEIVDSTTTLPNVLLWDTAAPEIVHVTGRDLMAKWSQCHLHDRCASRSAPYDECM